MSVLFRLLNTEMRDEIPTNLRWRRQYVTSRKQQVSAIFDSNDLPTRFRTNSPHYRWPVADNKDSLGETSTYRAIQCIENPCSLPLYIIHARNILAQFDRVIEDFYEECRGDTEQAIEARRERVEITVGKLTKTNVRMFGKFSHDSLQTTSEVGIESGPILKDLSLSAKENEDAEAILAEDRFRDWGLRWDPNRIDWHEINADPDGDTGRAFAILMEAIDRERKNAKKIILSRGDMLLVDNLRCLVARQEPPARTVFQSLFGIPQDWWLAGYYGFRQSMKSMREPFEERYKRLGDQPSAEFAMEARTAEPQVTTKNTAQSSPPMMVRRR